MGLAIELYTLSSRDLINYTYIGKVFDSPSVIVYLLIRPPTRIDQTAGSRRRRHLVKV